MGKSKKTSGLQQGIVHLLEEAKHKSLSVKEIIKILSGKGRTVILILLSLPFCQPVQIPGMSIPFGIITAFLGLRMAFGKQMWLPKKMLNKKVSSKTIQKIGSKSLFIVKKLGKLIRPRLRWMIYSRCMRVANGLVVVGMGICLAFPLPIPFANIGAAWAILLLTLGILEDDGVFVIAGYVFFFATAVFFIAMGISLEHAFRH